MSSVQERPQLGVIYFGRLYVRPESGTDMPPRGWSRRGPAPRVEDSLALAHSRAAHLARLRRAIPKSPELHSVGGAANARV